MEVPPVTTPHYTALPLATLALTAHTRPLRRPAGSSSDDQEQRSDGVRRGAESTR